MYNIFTGNENHVDPFDRTRWPLGSSKDDPQFELLKHLTSIRAIGVIYCQVDWYQSTIDTMQISY